MQMTFFQVPVRGDSELQEEFNRFLRSHRVLTIQREFVADGGNSFWALAVEYLDGVGTSGKNEASGGSGSRKARVDYKEILSPEDFAVFAKLRDWRKERSEKESVPVYAVFTNEQLAKVAVGKPDNEKQLREVEGIGEAKSKKYGDGVLEALRKIMGESGDTPTMAKEAIISLAEQDAAK